jgi:hypothetical protein
MRQSQRAVFIASTLFWTLFTVQGWAADDASKMGELPIWDQIRIDAVLFTILVFGGAIGGYLSARQSGMQRIPGSKIVLGSAGAIIIVTIGPIDNILDKFANRWVAHDVIGLIALALVGGYAGGALIEASAGRYAKKIDELTEDQNTRNRESNNSLIAKEFAQRILKGHELTDSEIQKFEQALNESTSDARWQIYLLAEENRHQNWKDEKEYMERSLAIFQALVDSSDAKSHHWWHASLAFCLKVNPDYVRAVKYLDQAINLRGEQEIKSGAYEFNRAYINIQLMNSTGHNRNNKNLKKKIDKDLEAARRFQRWKSIIDADGVIQGWKNKHIGPIEKIASIRPA